MTAGILPFTPNAETGNSMLSQKEILQEQAKLRMDELRAIGANISYFRKEVKDEAAAKREEQEYRIMEDKLQATLMKIRELYGDLS